MENGESENDIKSPYKDLTFISYRNLIVKFI